MSFVFVNNTMETFTPTSSGALATVIWECCRIAQSEGIEPFVITQSSAQECFPWSKLIVLDYPKLPANKLMTKALRAERKFTGWRHLRQQSYVARVVKAIKQAGLADLPLVLMNDPEMAVALRRSFPKSKIVHWFFNQMDCREPFRQRFAESVDTVMAVSNFTGRYVSDYFQLGQKPVQTLYIAADTTAFHPGEESHDVPIINFVGRTCIEKAPDLLLRAAAKVATQTKAFRLQILGSNHWDRFEMDDFQRLLCDLTSELEEQGIEVRRPGHIDRHALPGEMRKADIHVMPSRWDEPFALATLEGMASGLATIASKTGGTPEAIGDSGLLFERDNADELAAHLLTLLSDKTLRQDYAKKARDRSQVYTWDKTWAGLKTLTAV